MQTPQGPLFPSAGRPEQPRQRLWRRGVRSLSDAELLSLLLRSGSRDRSALELAEELLAEKGVLGLLPLKAMNLLSKRGFGEANAATVVATVELGRRLARARVTRRLLEQPERVARYLYLRYLRWDQEVMGTLYLNSRHHLIDEQEHYRGTLSRAAVEPRAILRGALECGAAGMVVWHTHPSGDPVPSTEDLAFTRRLAKAGDQIGVRLVDHLILGAGGLWVSVKDRGGWIG